MHVKIWMNAGIVTALLGFSGCLDQRGDVDEAPVLAVTEPEPSRLVNESFDLQTLYAASAGGVTLGDMTAVHVSPLSDNATRLSLVATWDAAPGVGSEQKCMVHDATSEAMGVMLASGSGPSPLRVGPTNLTAQVKRVGVMCWAHGDPAISLSQIVHVVLSLELAPIGR